MLIQVNRIMKVKISREEIILSAMQNTQDNLYLKRKDGEILNPKDIIVLQNNNKRAPQVIKIYN